MRIATFNVNSLNARMEQLERFIGEQQPDVLCLQETKLPDDRLPADALKALGYPHLVFTGQKAYNGVAMLSKHPIESPQIDFRDEPHPDRRIVVGTVQGIRIYGLYCPNGTKVGSPRFHGKLDWYRRLRTEIDTYHQPGDALLITGDFNVTPTDMDTWDPFGTEGKLLCTVEERAALQNLIDFGFTEAWREKNPFSVDFSWWDYQRMGFSRNQGLRIDHFLLTQTLMDRCTDVTIHREARGWDNPSDHAPVTVDLD